MIPNYMNDTIRKFQRREKLKAFRRSAWNDIVAAVIMLAVVLILIVTWLMAWDNALMAR